MEFHLSPSTNDFADLHYPYDTPKSKHTIFGFQKVATHPPPSEDEG